MAIPYKPLWHLLIEREMNKEDLKRAATCRSIERGIRYPD